MSGEVVSIQTEDGAKIADFTYIDLKIRLVRHFRDWFRDRRLGKHLMVERVIPAVPTSPQLLPCLTVRAVNDSVEKIPIGLDFTIEGEDGSSQDTEGAYWREGFEIRYFCENYELRDAVRPWLRAAIFDTFGPLDALGAQLPEVTGGQDEEDFDSQAPQQLYMLVYNVSFRVPVVRTHIWWEKAAGVDVGVTVTEPPKDPVDLSFITRIQGIGQPQ